MIKGIRRISTQSNVKQLFNVLQSSSNHEKRVTLQQLINTYIKQNPTESSNLVDNVIKEWANEQPTKEALWVTSENNNECKKFTFGDIYEQTSRLANVLNGNEFELKKGQTVLAILPYKAPERILLQLACLQSGLIYCPYDPKNVTDVGFFQHIQKLNVACVITDEDSIEAARRYTYNTLRPLKKGLITNCSTSKALPVGWIHLMQRAADAESTLKTEVNVDHNTPVLRFLSKNGQPVEYSQKLLNIQLVITAMWLNSQNTSRLTWMKNQNDDINALSPWIFGSTIFFNGTENPQTMFNLLEKYPIDTLCASSMNYQALENQLEEKKSQLTQLFSTEPLDPEIKQRWHSVTNLRIRDDYGEFNAPSMPESPLK